MEDFKAALGHFMARLTEDGEIVVILTNGSQGVAILSREEAADLAQWLVVAREYVKEGPTG